MNDLGQVLAVTCRQKTDRAEIYRYHRTLRKTIKSAQHGAVSAQGHHQVEIGGVLVTFDKADADPVFFKEGAHLVNGIIQLFVPRQNADFI